MTLANSQVLSRPATKNLMMFVRSLPALLMARIFQISNLATAYHRLLASGNLRAKCGIIGNNGPIDPDGATKAAQFIQLMDQADTPLIFLQNTTGYLVGKDYEQAGMIKHGSKMIQAVTNTSVPRITMMIGASFGAGNYGMCGRGYDPDFCVTWPNAATGVMGGEQAATVMGIVAEAQAARSGVEMIHKLQPSKKPC